MVFSDAVFVVENISVEEPQEAVADIQPDEIYPGWKYGLPANIPDDLNEKQAYSLWWH